MQETFGRLLNRRRFEIKKTIEVIAKELGVGASNVSTWELEETFPAENKLLLISAIYCIPLEELKSKLVISRKRREEEKKRRFPIKTTNVKPRTVEQMFGCSILPAKDLKYINKPNDYNGN